jgi:diphthine synthase
MTFNLIGTGLNEKSITLEALELIKKSKKVYLENYTVDFPYLIEKLEETIGKKIEELPREKVESEDFIKQAKKEDISLLVYGDSLSATTHSELILSCKKNKIPFRIVHNASVLTAIAETGLQLYKFGKTASMPTWKDNWKPESFADLIKQNLSIQAHTLLLVDIALSMEKAKQQLVETFKNQNISVGKIVVCSELGVGSKIIYDEVGKLSNKIKSPYCFIIPAKLHFLEEEFLKSF